MAWRQRGHELVVDHRVTGGDRVRVTVRYAGRPRRHSYAGESNWLANRREVVAMNEPHMAPWWFPANDHPRDKALIDLHITVPKGLQVVANGTRVGRTVRGGLATTHWSAKEPMAPYLAFFTAGRFATARGVHEGLPWTVAVSKALSPSSRRVAMRLMKRTPTLLSWLETQLGRLPVLRHRRRDDGAQSRASRWRTRPVRRTPCSSARTGWRPWCTSSPTSGSVTRCPSRAGATSGSTRARPPSWRSATGDRGDFDAQQWLLDQHAGRGAGDGFWHREVADPGPRRIFDRWSTSAAR